MTLAPGTRLGPYEVLAPLGAGGMGEVFRARDTRLGRDVAIKVLPDHFAGDPKALRRFETEAKAVAALSHPNILSLFDVGETNGTRYAVTELLEGEPLRALVLRGPVPVKRALEIAREVAEGLAAAHEKGIVHRDVKPENVFLTKDGHVKLLDFGLAHHETASRDIGDTHTPTVSARTEAGAVMGTVAYMSPEQARGMPVDHRTDQFSLGVTLYEMLAGRRPFRGSDGASLISAILRDEPESLEIVAPSVAVGVRLVVERCLAKEPRERWASTGDLARDLASWREHSSGAPGPGESASGVPVSASSAALSTSGRSPAARRRLVAAIAAGVLVLVALVGAWVWRGRAGSEKVVGTTSSRAAALGIPALDPKRIAVAPFENRTGDPSLDLIERMATEWVTEGISGVGIDVVPSAIVRDVSAATPDAGAPGRRETIRALAERTGAGLLVSGGFHLRGEDLQFQAQVTDLSSGRLVRALEPATAPRTDPMPAIDSLRTQVRNIAFARLQDRGDNLLKHESAPPKYEAFREYLLGDDVFGVDYAAAERHLRRALEIDPGYVFPRIQLAAGFWNQGRREDAAREIALLEPLRPTLSPVMRCYLDCWKAQLAGEPEKELVFARELVALSPGDPGALYSLSTVSLWANRPREAVEALTAPSRWELFVNPSRPFMACYYDGLARARHALGQHDEELAGVRLGLETFTSRPTLLLRAEVTALVALGRLGDVDKVVEEGLARTNEPPLGAVLMLEAADELRGHGHPEEAREMAARAVVALGAVPEGKRGGEERRVMALSLLGAERWREAVPLLASLEKEQPLQGIRWKGLRALALLRSGDLAAASRLEEELRRMDRPYLLGENVVYLAALAAARGDKERAVGLLRQAIVAGHMEDMSPPSYYAHRAVQLAPLLGYPPFEELVKPKG